MYGAYANLVNELKIEDAQQFKIFIRMSAVDLEELLLHVGKYIKKQDTQLRAAITPSERLMVTLRFLVTGKYFCNSRDPIISPIDVVQVIHTIP
jgi:hypothetical protein